MEMLKLGPNGALVYCMEFLETNFEWLVAAMKKFPQDKYFLFDFPGQVELYTHHNSVKNIVARLEKEANCRLAAVHLVRIEIWQPFCSHTCAVLTLFRH
jgi:hypothetical protein